MGLRPSPPLVFSVAFAPERDVTAKEQQKLKEMGDIYANVYGARVNPLNNRVVGPDKDSPKGIVLLTLSNGPSSTVRVIKEFTPIALGDVIADIEPLSDKWFILEASTAVSAPALSFAQPGPPPSKNTIPIENQDQEDALTDAYLHLSDICKKKTKEDGVQPTTDTVARLAAANPPNSAFSYGFVASGNVVEISVTDKSAKTIKTNWRMLPLRYEQ